jgi:hypothetical protein
MDNRFEGYIDLNGTNFTFEIIEKKVDSIEIYNKQYRNIYLLRSEYYENTYAYISKDNGIIEIVNDSIKLIPLNN